MGSGPPSKPTIQLTKEQQAMIEDDTMLDAELLQTNPKQSERELEEAHRKYAQALEANKESQIIYELHKAYNKAIFNSKNDEDMLRNVKPALLKLVMKIPAEDRDNAYDDVLNNHKFWSGAEFIEAVKGTLRAIRDDFVEESIDPGHIEDRAFLHIKRKGWNRKSLSYIQFSDTVNFVFYPKIPEGKELDFKDEAAWREDYYSRHKFILGRTLSHYERRRFKAAWDISDFRNDPRSPHKQLVTNQRQAAVKKSDLAKAELEFDRFMQDEGLGIDELEREEQWESYTQKYRDTWEVSLEDLPIPEQYQFKEDDTRRKRGDPDT